MDIRVARLEADVTHFKADLATVRTNDTRYASVESRLAKLADELRSLSIDVAWLKALEKVLLSTTAISFAMAILAIIIAISSRHDESHPRAAAAPAAVSEKPAS